MALIALLRSGRLPRPVPVTAPPKEPADGQGWVESSISYGELFLQSDDGTVYRLTWEPEQQDRRRAVPAGRYKLRGYRILKRDKQGAVWHISVSSPGLRDVAVQAGQAARIEITPAISFDCQIRRQRQGLTVFTPVAGDGNGGLSVYRRGRRLPLQYRLISARGAVVGGGLMRYG